MVRSAVSMSIPLRRPGRAGRTLPATLSPRLFEDLLRRDALLEEIFPLALEGPRGADPDALPAKDAAGGGHGPVEEGGDRRVKTASAERERIGVLGVFGAHLDAAPAQDAFGVVAQIDRVVVEARRLAGGSAGESLGMALVGSEHGVHFGRLREIDGRSEHLQDGAPGAFDIWGAGVNH